MHADKIYFNAKTDFPDHFLQFHLHQNSHEGACNINDVKLVISVMLEFEVNIKEKKAICD